MDAASRRARPPHILRRGDTFYLRVRVPRDLISRLGAEVRRSLGVSRLSDARVLGPIYAARVKRAFAMIQLQDLTPAQSAALVAQVFNDLRQEADIGFVCQTREPREEVADQRRMAEDEIHELERHIDSRQFPESARAHAARRLQGYGVELDSLAPATASAVLTGLARALVEQQHLFLHRLDDPLGPYEPRDAMFRPAVQEGCGIVPLAPAGPTIQELADYYLSKKKASWTAKTYKSNEHKVRFLVEHLGANRRAALVTTADLASYQDAVLRLSKNHHVGAGRSFLSRQTDVVSNRITPKTAALIFDSAKAFFRWAKSKGQVPNNPAEGIIVDVPKQAKSTPRRRPFTAGELKTLFGSPAFRGCRSAHHRHQVGDFRPSDAKYWIPIIGYYTGMRLGEIVQLHMSDVHLEGPVPYFHVTEEAGGEAGSGAEKHVKSEAGVRRVPVHPDLIALGFGQFVAHRRKWNKAKPRLFFEVDFGADGQASTTFSKWFGRLMDQVGLSDPALVFHSFRHGMEDAFRDSLAPQYLIDRVIGHADGKVSSGYGQGVSLPVAFEALQTVKLPVSLLEIIGRSG